MSLAVVTGGAGFIGSNLTRGLLRAGYEVRVVDDFSTGRRENLAGLETRVSPGGLLREGSVTDPVFLHAAFAGAEIVFHQAAIPSVPRSIADPLRSNEANITGTLTVLLAARECGVGRVIYAASSSAYGGTAVLPTAESQPAKVRSPYALTKLAGEEYCRLFTEIHGLETVSLRYFNVFGPRQNPDSQYAAVIPKFITRMLDGLEPVIYGDGTQSRDFTFVDNVVAANLLAARAPAAAVGKVFNIACGHRSDLNELVSILNRILGTSLAPRYEPPQAGDVLHSQADLSLAHALLDYSPGIDLEEGLAQTVNWYRQEKSRQVHS